MARARSLKNWSKNDFKKIARSRKIICLAPRVVHQILYYLAKFEKELVSTSSSAHILLAKKKTKAFWTRSRCVRSTRKSPSTHAFVCGFDVHDLMALKCAHFIRSGARTSNWMYTSSYGRAYFQPWTKHDKSNKIRHRDVVGNCTSIHSSNGGKKNGKPTLFWLIRGTVCALNVPVHTQRCHHQPLFHIFF